MGERRCVYRVQAGKSEGKKPPGRPVHIRVDEIYRLVRGLWGVDWTDMVRTGLIWSGQGKWRGFEHGNET